jgi:signal transduction protein with GAF and PtsI domain
MVEAGGVLFEFDYGEVWSAAVYRYNEGSNLLEPAWWHRPDEHPSEGAPRSWQPGDGHVGSAFMQSRILFTTDAASEETSPLLQPSTGNERDYDSEIYRSFVSAPILLDLKPEPLKFGVLVITSNVAGRFDGENQSVVAHAAQVLAHLFHWRELALKTRTS